MNITRDEAAAALGEVDAAGHRVRTLRMYAYAAPFLILWGVIWLVANAASDLGRPWGSRAWIAGSVIGFALTLYWTIRNSRTWQQRYGLSPQQGRALGRRFSLLGTTMMVFFPSILAIIGPLSARQSNALLSLVWAFVYMAAGAFIGWRLFAIGAFTAAAILFGFLFVHEHYGLWMGFFGGGSLIVGGLWLRKI
jgi:hypothetical protein